MVHDKTGIFSDGDGNRVAFSGSMNETYLGLSPDGNWESIDVFPDWLPDAERDRQRTVEISKTFDAMWEGSIDGVVVTPFPSASRLFLEEHASTARPWREIADELALVEREIRERESQRRVDEPVLNLRDHQKGALQEWASAGHRGVVAHATGAGKTITAIQAIREHGEAGGNSLVVVPSKELLNQWIPELNKFVPANQRVHQCGGGDEAWKKNLDPWLHAEDPQVLVATFATARNESFRFSCNQGPGDLLIVGDEVHGLGSEENSKIFEIDASARLGLSATPERHRDSEGTDSIFNYFGPVVHEYSLYDAIRDGFLVQYRYHPVVVTLDDSEQEQWDDLSKEIGQAVARHGSLEAAMRVESIKLLFIQRSRIAKKASAKVAASHSIVSRDAEAGQRWLLYCEDQDHLAQVRALLTSADLPLPVYEFHSQMTGDREATLKRFRDDGGVIISIRCLDEGVDIPDASHALILASSQNPRQFIQRRGRVLRLPDEEGIKDYAHIHDVLVVPRPPIDPTVDALVLGEIARASEFCENASNPECRTTLLEELDRAGIDLEACIRHRLFGIDESEGEEDNP
jgi:superfamily II DNA or RNA helicase